jgi:hypothetical protein
MATAIAPARINFFFIVQLPDGGFAPEVARQEP